MKEELYIRLQKALSIRNMKQVDLCEKTGIAKSKISQYVRGDHAPKLESVYLLAKALEVEEAWLMGYDVPMEPKPAPSAGAEAAAGAGPAGAMSQLTPDAAQLVSKYNRLDTLDKGKTHGYVDNLLTDEKYKKEDLTTAG